MQLIQFHNHSCEDSLLDSCLKIEDLVKWAKDNGMPAIGLSGHGEMSGLIKLYKECQKMGIKPLLGIEMYVTENTQEKVRDHLHIVLLAKNKEGWDNLIKLHNNSWKDTYYGKPRTNFCDLKQYSNSLVATSACIGGVAGQYYFKGELEKAEQNILLCKDIFKDNFYLEMQEHLIEGQKKYNFWLIEMSKKHDIPLIIQNDSHYELSTDAFAHEILLAKNTGSKLSDAKRYKFDTQEFYLKTTEQIRETFDYIDDDLFKECCKNTQQIADNIEIFDLIQPQYSYPKICKTEEESVKKLQDLIKTGFSKRFIDKNIDKKVYFDRIKHEFEVVKKLDTVDYFLLLHDVCSFCERENVYTNFSRGSGLSSLILYCLGVTHLDPIPLNLPFSRFLNEYRKNAADFDLDCDDNDRDRVIDYIYEKYGSRYVANIATYGTLTAKASFKTVASVMEYPFDKANQISKEINEKVSLEENIKTNSYLEKIYENDSKIKEIIDIAKRLEGVKDKRGLHASAVVISNQPLDSICPCIVINRNDGKTFAATSFSMVEVDTDLKLLKLDILGLKNLGIVKNTINMIKENHGVNIDFKNIPFNDINTYKLLQEGRSGGIFQLESNGMTSLLKRIKPTEHKHLDAIVALFRPGATQYIEQYIENKNNPSKTRYIDERVKNILEPTYGQIVYQEQIMFVSMALAGFNMAEADVLRYAIGKKKEDLLREQEEKFVSGCVSNNFEETKARKLFSEIMAASSYSFNKAHSAAYSALAYVTAYLKANYFPEFMCSLLNVTDDEDKRERYLSEYFEAGKQVLPPDINNSAEQFTLNKDKNIIFSLSSIKGLGTKTVQSIINNRVKYGEFKSFLDFCQRCAPDKGTLVALLESNTLSTIEDKPHKWLSIIDFVCYAISDYKKDKSTPLMDLIKQNIHKDIIKNDEKIKQLIERKRAVAGHSKKAKEERTQIDTLIHGRGQELLPSVEVLLQKHNYGFTRQEVSENEAKYLAYRITTNPSNIFQRYKKCFNFTPISEITTDNIGEKVTIVGEIKSIRETITKKTKERMAFGSIGYLGDNIPFVIWSSNYSSIYINQGDFVQIQGTIRENNNKEFGEIQLDIHKLNVLECINNECVHVQNIDNLDGKQKNILKQLLTNISNICYNNNKKIQYIVQLEKDGKIYTLPSNMWIDDLGEFKRLCFQYGVIK